MTDPTNLRRRGILASLRASFLTGLVVVLPIGLTIYFVWTLIGWIDGWILPLIPSAYQPEALVQDIFGPDANFPVRGVGVLVFLVFTVIIGWMAKGLFGRSVIRWGEDMVDRMPIVRSVYGGIKQVAETFFNKKEQSFDKVCLVEFPRPGSYALGFLSTRPKGELATRLAALGPDMSAVFVGLTPFTSGMLLFVPTKDLTILDMKIDDAAKLIVSGGLVYPIPKEPIS
ncbi:MAG: DUF502 domain-containing protein [Tabrizicola sp.]|uniref:DUF502 domain-containing protein n=1 Tax=Tabrizicola sp. TaxID=2005166 RepID=UPI002733B552|nr:DUF502 domain-containing protein [Tabrizicola sp.]MDP3263312.1 DUF502 domain-containing protein [Tabrizicola sp.]MDP3646669.1 DUF502 domain-containing protein [Paracoccaceae bacterium]MDZ4068199.1 DUF502 domain-containing protein [Tabrizicola sp.]